MLDSSKLVTGPGVACRVPEGVGGDRRESAGASPRAGVPDPELAERPRRRRFTAEYKLGVLREAGACTRKGEIGAMLRREGLDTVMVYAKLYPTTLIEEYRKAVRGSFLAAHGSEALRNPTAEEWQEFSRSCGMRDMGTHLCALPAGEHCSRGLVCLGCNHAQPKKSAAATFRQMLVSHRRELTRAHKRDEPAGQIAARELEIVRIEHALQRAEELPVDVAEAIESAA